MSLQTTRGVVIAEKSFNETDKILTIFSENGKFKAIANGVKNPKSSLAAGCRLFAFTEFQYYSGKNFAKISQAHLIESFYSISSDLTAIWYASYVADLVNSFYDDFQIDKILLKNLVFFYFYLNKRVEQVYLLTLAFQLKILLAAGIQPDIKSIAQLDRSLPIYFNINDSSFSNMKSLNKICYRLNPEDISTLITLYQLPINKIKDLDLNKFSEDSLKQLIKIFNHYIESQLNKKINSFEIISEL